MSNTRIKDNTSNESVTLNVGPLLNWSCLSLEVWGELLPHFTDVLLQCSQTSGVGA